MCGIFGLVASSDESVDDYLTFKPSERRRPALDHRGPDDWGRAIFLCDGAEVYLEHSRLSIIGLGPQGRQPFPEYGNASVVLSYNGEIYNYRKLRRILKGRHGQSFTTDTDTEVVYKGYKVWGLQGLLSRLVGIYAFCLADRRKGCLFLVRDPLGVKPLYYTQAPFSFASEAKAIFEHTRRNPHVNYQVIGEYIANFWVYEPDTLFRGVRKLEAGHYLRLDCESGNVQKTQYWDILEDGDSAPAQDSELEADLHEVISDQLVSDVDVGMYLSGGIDSTIVAHYASQHQELLALNLETAAGETGEGANVSRLEEASRLKVERFTPHADMLDVYRQMTYHMDEPIADPAIIPAYLLAEEASERGVRVMLSGMGGDEIFAGYRRMNVLKHRQLLKAAHPLIRAAAQVYPGRNSRVRRNLTRVANFAAKPAPDNYFSLAYYYSREEVTALVGGSQWWVRFSSKIRDLLADKNFVDDLQVFQYLDIRGYLSSHNLLYMDKASMAASVEARVPLLDHRLAKKYFNLSTRRKLQDGLKGTLKNHLVSIRGEEYLPGRKEGFSFPIDQLVQTSKFSDQMRRMRHSPRLTSLLGPKEVRRVVDREYERGTPLPMKLWCIYTLWLWLEEFDVQL